MNKTFFARIVIVITVIFLFGKMSYAQLPSYFSMLNQPTDTLRINDTFTLCDTIYPFQGIDIITGLAFSGIITHTDLNSVARIILVDSSNNEYLIFESYPLIIDDLDQEYESNCEETVILDSIHPMQIRFELLNTDLSIDNFILSSNSTYPYSNFIADSLHNKQINYKIDEIKSNIQTYQLGWIADSTNISHYWFTSRDNLFLCYDTICFQGFEYYAGGVYNIPEIPTEPLTTLNTIMVDSFDWRYRHGAMNTNSPYFNNSDDNQGWMTKVKDQLTANTCSFFATMSTLEGLTNLYFNQFLNYDLSEQDFASCTPINNIPQYFTFLSSSGVTTEYCFPYANIPLSSPSFPSCSSKCNNPDTLVFNSGYQIFFSYGSAFPEKDSIKKWLIKFGPLYCGICGHALALVGYYNDYQDNNIIWILKDSYGPSGPEQGYSYYQNSFFQGANQGIYSLSVPIAVSGTSIPTISCLDLDQDGYYNWGIGPKPAQCPQSPDLEDCDDSDPSFGPMDVDGSCSRLLPYTMSFEENDLLDWKQGRLDDFNWTFNTGSTPTSLTGPDSAYDGSYYVYIEATGQDEDDTADLISPSIYLNGDCNPQLHFAYHMYGSETGELSISVSEDGGVSWYGPLWNETGLNDSTWRTDSIDLSAYVDEIIKLKFTATRSNGEHGDIAIDYIRVNADTPEITLNSNEPICSKDTLKLFATGGETYQWYGPNGFISNDSTIELTNADTTYTGYYKCSVFNDSGCHRIDSIFVNVYDCCSDSIIKIYSNSSVSSLTEPLPQKFAILGEFTVDESFQFDPFSEVIMLPSSGINVLSGFAFEVRNSYLHGCQQMWNTINIEEDATLTIDSTLIEDGLYAITANDNNVLILTNNHFRRNFIGLYYAPPVDTSEMRIYNDFVFSGNEFECEGTSMLSPKADEVSFAGVSVSNYEKFFLYGDSLNLYHHMKNGIMSYNTDLTVKNSYFSSIIDTATDAGSGIYCETNLQTPNFLTVEGHAGVDDTTFMNCQYGIYVTKMNTQLRYVKMHDVNIGAFINGSQYCALEMNRNLFACRNMGIFLWHNDPVSSINIYENIFNVNCSQSQSPSYAIFQAEWNNSPLDSCCIHNNYILQDTSSIGIRLLTASRSQVYENYIYMVNPESNIFGVSAEYCQNNNIRCNMIWGIDPDQGDTVNLYPRGIRALETIDSKFSCNVLGDLFVGASFQNRCLGDSIQGNEFYDHKLGLYYNGYAITGEQRHKGNTWNGSYTGGYGAKHDGDQNTVSQSLYYCKNSPSYLLPPSVNVGNWFYPTGDTATYTCQLCPMTDYYSLSDSLTSLDYNIGNGLLTFEDYEEESNWIVARYLFNKIKMNDLYNTSSPVIQSFYDSINDVSSGKFQEVEILTKDAFAIDSNYKTQIKYAIFHVNQLLDSIQLLDSLLGGIQSTPDSILLVETKENLLIRLSVHKASYEDLIDLVKITQVLKMDTVIEKNALLPFNDIFEQNEKSVNDIYFNSVSKGMMKFSTEQELILSIIANQCPLAGGNAVYKARSLYSLIKDTIYNDDILCRQVGFKNSPLQESDKKKADHSFSIFPNPANSSINITWNNPVDEMATLLIVDLLGQVTFTTSFTLSENQFSVSTRELISGVFQVCIQIQNGDIECRKLVIIK